MMAETAREDLPTLKFRPGQKVISLMTRPTLEELSELIAPASPLLS